MVLGQTLHFKQNHDLQMSGSPPIRCRDDLKKLDDMWTDNRQRKHERCWTPSVKGVLLLIIPPQTLLDTTGVLEAHSSLYFANILSQRFKFSSRDVLHCPFVWGSCTSRLEAKIMQMSIRIPQSAKLRTNQPPYLPLHLLSLNFLCSFPMGHSFLLHNDKWVCGCE